MDLISVFTGAVLDRLHQVSCLQARVSCWTEILLVDFVSAALQLAILPNSRYPIFSKEMLSEWLENVTESGQPVATFCSQLHQRLAVRYCPALPITSKVEMPKMKMAHGTGW